MMDWYAQFRDLTAHLRGLGWRRPFILCGQTLRSPGVVNPDFMRFYCRRPPVNS
jgi:hypothetical protein